MTIEITLLKIFHPIVISFSSLRFFTAIHLKREVHLLLEEKTAELAVTMVLKLESYRSLYNLDA